VPDNIILLANITVYIKEARTLKEAIKHVYKLVIKFEIAIK
jgi:hypothetical protein